jgi:hypothetical protein
MCETDGNSEKYAGKIPEVLVNIGLGMIKQRRAIR